MSLDLLPSPTRFLNPLPIEAVSAKVCRTCGEFKGVSEFYRRASRADGRDFLCADCRRELKRRYWQANRERVLPKRRKQRREPTEWEQHLGGARRSYRRAGLKRKYNMQPGQYEAMLDSQNHRCGICGRHEDEFKHSLHVDHCHKTDRVRGLLCGACNGRLHALENREWREKATAYLRRVR